MDTLGRRLKCVRNLLKMTQEDFANELGATAPSINAYENDVTFPPGAFFKALNEKFGVSYRFLYEGVSIFEPRGETGRGVFEQLNTLLEFMTASKKAMEVLEYMESDSNFRQNILSVLKMARSSLSKKK